MKTNYECFSQVERVLDEKKGHFKVFGGSAGSFAT